MPEVILFGAGATGRGHVGLHVWLAGCHVTFVDKNRALVDALASAGAYTARLYADGCREIVVSDFDVFYYEERDAIADAISRADLVLTAVFDQNLSDVAQTVARAVTASRLAGRTLPLNFIACENMMGSSSVLARHVYALLDDADRGYCDAYFGFPDCMISRVVPRPRADSLDIIAEDYSEWTANVAEFRGPKPEWLYNLELVDNQDARLERKLFIHNGGHAICGYNGFHRGHRYIHEAVADPVVGQAVLGALDELGEVVRRKHGFSAESIEKYKQDLVRRGAVPEMQDEILRVVRDPIRKLSPRERLVAPALLAVEYGLPRTWIVRGIVAALRYHHPADAQSVRLHDLLAERGLRPVLAEVCELPEDSPLAAEIEAEFNAGEEFNADLR
jgi:mannitol-1-phosphate 5-dehydrogenase